MALLCLSLCVQGQVRPIDSLRNELEKLPVGKTRIDLLNQLANRYYDIKISDSLFMTANKALDLSEKLNYKDGQLAAYSVLSSGYWYISDYEQAFITANKGKDLAMELGNSEDLSNSLIVLGLINSVTGKYEAAFLNYFEALRIAEESENLPIQSRVLNNIGYLYIATGDDKEAIEPLKRAIANNDKVGNESRYAVYYNNLAVAYKNLNDHESAFKYLEIALNSAKRTNNQSQTGVILRSFGQTHLQIGEYDEALRYAEEAIALQRTLPSKVELIRSMNLSGDIYLQNRNYSKAIQLAQEALSLAKQVGTQLEQARALHTIYISLEKQGKYREAYNRLQQYNVVNDSILGQEKIREIGRLESKAELERQAQENERLQIENELNKAQVENEEARTTILAIIIASLTLLVFASFYVIRNKQRSNDQISQQKEALEKTTAELSKTNTELNELSSFKEGLTNMIAHDMKNSLNSIIGYSANDLNDKRMAGIHQSGQNILNLVLNMLDVQRFEEAKVQLNRRKHSMAEIMAEALDRVQPLANEKRVNLEMTQNKVPTVEVDGSLIMRVMVNLLTNAIKYTGPKTTVSLTCQVNEHDGRSYLTTSVTDQGVGIEKELLPHIFDKFWQNKQRESGSTPSTGLGLTFCKLAIESHQGRIYAESELGFYTTISFDLPLANNAVLAATPEGKATGEEFTEKEKQLLATYAKELKELKYYQVQALKEVIGRLEAELDTKWSKDLMSAAFEGNQSKYESLINQALS